MEKQLFDYDDLDIWDEGHYVFYNCRLKQSIGLHLPGTVFSSISIDFGKGILTIWSEDGTEAIDAFNLTLQVVSN